MNSQQFKFTNKLINEKSPYLLQHAHNPVNWFPWGEEAFSLAKKQNKPIFLSIGYSTCHWCHVMEHESFEDEEVAKLLNENFICIKVDREERPDIDNIYMKVCQMLTGSGGWPLTIIMTPDQKPFFAGTYFPKHSRGNRIGMLDLLPKITSAWQNDHDKVVASAENITSHLTKDSYSGGNQIPTKEILEISFSDFVKNYDSKYGGFGNRPKFPSPHNLLFLLRYYESHGKNEALQMVTHTLKEMRKGGIYDHIGFGFHRYSTDEKWFLPHFEKMLYDQAMLAMVFTEAYQITKEDIFKRTTEEILTYVLRDMTSPGGGFYSAEDADSEGEEGKFYVWTKQEILENLGKEQGELFCKFYNISKSGNYFEEATGQPTGTNIPYLTNLNNLDKVKELRKSLFDLREERIHPYKDDKILTDWNGLMIAAFAKAGRVFDNSEFVNVAINAVNFITQKLYDGKNLLHRYRDGEAAIKAHLDDYAFLSWGLLELYSATFNIYYLKTAVKYMDYVINNLWDKENNNGFYFTEEKHNKLITNSKEYYDGAIPSGNSVLYNNLIVLNKMTSNNNYLKYIDYLSITYKPLLEQVPRGYAHFLSGLNYLNSESKEIIIVGEKDDAETRNIIKEINNYYLPNAVTMFINKKNYNQLNEIAPYTESYSNFTKTPLVYICKNYSCSMPASDLKKIKALLEN